MSAPRGEGDSLIFLSHFVGRDAEPRNVTRNETVPILYRCSPAAITPEPRRSAAARIRPQDMGRRRRRRRRLRNRGEALANFALSLRGARYRYGGATRDGFDCSGLVFYAHRQFGLAVPRTSREQAEEAEEVKPRKLQAAATSCSSRSTAARSITSASTSASAISCTRRARANP